LRLTEMYFFTDGRSVFEKASSRWGDLHLSDCCGAVSYMSKRLRWLAEISYELEARYTYDMRGEAGRIVAPTPNHPQNAKLWVNATNAVALLHETKKHHVFEDETLKGVVRLALASLKRDGFAIPFNFELEFRPLQVCIDALSAAIKDEKLSFWTNLWVELLERDVDLEDCLWSPKSRQAIENRISFLRADLENCRTNKSPTVQRAPKKLTVMDTAISRLHERSASTAQSQK
jgi:hypothetical protein